MDEDQESPPSAFPRSREAFSALVAYLRSEEALALPLDEVEACIEAEYHKLMSLLVQEHDDLVAGGQAGAAETEAGHGC
jgi:hypothetical protein